MSARERGTQGPPTGNVADVLEGQVERGLMKLLDELAGLGFGSSGRQLVVNGQAHVVYDQIPSTTSTGCLRTDFPFASLISAWGKTQTGRDDPASTAKPVRTLCRFSTLSISTGN